MTIGRVFAGSAAALALVVACAADAGFAQEKPQDVPKLTKPQLAQLQTLTTLVDSVIAGKEPAPSDATLKANFHFVKSSNNVFVPYLVEFSSGRFTSFPVAVYVR
ncbi:MAG: hypothetical protein ABIS29_06415, partial [Vicinamibacterales bacterium]